MALQCSKLPGSQTVRVVYITSESASRRVDANKNFKINFEFFIWNIIFI